MLRLNEPEEFWGIAHANTELTGALWCQEQFVFKHQAQAYCDKVSVFGVVTDLRPVLVQMTATLVSAEAAEAYEARQRDFLDKRKARSACA
jgi:hypothetical protein